MAYTESVVWNLGASRAGLTLTAQLVDSTDTEVGGSIAVTEIGGGAYRCSTSVDNGFEGAIELRQGTAVLGAANVGGIMDSVHTDTNELQTDWADGGRLDVILDARSSHTAANVVTALGTGSTLTALADKTTLDTVAADVAGLDGAAMRGTDGALTDKTGFALTAAYDAAKTAATQTSVNAIATILSGITSLASWLGLIAGKTADAGTLAEVNATTAGASYDNTTDSQEAIAETAGAIPTTRNIRTQEINVLTDD